MKTVLVFTLNENPMVARLWLRGFSRYAKGAKWFVEAVPRMDVFRSERKRLKDMIRFFNPCGIVSSYFEGLAGSIPSDIPVVWMDSAKKDVPPGDARVVHDDSAIATLAFKEFAPLGFRHFAVVGERPNHIWSNDRIEAFGRLVRRQGATFDVLRPPHPPLDKVACQKAIEPWLARLPLPCGVLAVCDRVAANVISAARRMGLKIPQDLAVVSVDNDEQICLMMDPPLTSIATDWEKGGYLAGELLERQMRNPKVRGLTASFGELGIMRRASSSLHASHVDARVAEACIYIREHACEGIGVEDVVRQMGCSRRLAELRYLEATGHSIFSEIREAQFARALILLSQRDIQLKAIADRCGWKSSMALRTYFEKRMRMTMREWRQKNAAG